MATITYANTFLRLSFLISDPYCSFASIDIVELGILALLIIFLSLKKYLNPENNLRTIPWQCSFTGVRTYNQSQDGTDSLASFSSSSFF